MQLDQDPRWLRLRPSRIHLALAVACALAAGGIVAWLPWPGWLRFALLGAVAGIALGEIRRARLLGRSAVNAFYLLDADGPAEAAADARESALGIRVRLGATVADPAAGPQAGNEAFAEGLVVAGAFVMPWITTLPYRHRNDPAWRRYFPRIIALWPDSLDAAAFRRVRVQLKWK